jgi:hypothetical protein
MAGFHRSLKEAEICSPGLAWYETESEPGALKSGPVTRQTFLIRRAVSPQLTRSSGNR